MSPVAEAEARAAAAVVALQFPQGEAAVKLDRKRSRRGVLFRLLFLGRGWAVSLVDPSVHGLTVLR